MDAAKSRHFLCLAVLSLFICAIFYFLYHLYILFKHRCVKVECWFCKNYTSVRAPNKNSFVCSSCSQYNGFTECGDYNCDIPAQYDASMNSSEFSAGPKRFPLKSRSDILCSECSRRQIYKVNMISQFEHSDEKTWDQEYKKFKKELESRCALCPSCTLKVYKHINSIDRRIIGKVLAWWRNRHQNEFSSETSCQTPLAFPIPLKLITSAVRFLAILIWLYISLPLLISSFDERICKRNSVKFLTHQCHHIDFLKSFVQIGAEYKPHLKIICLGSHLSLLLFQIFRGSANPFLTLLDTALFVFSANLLIARYKTVASASIFLSIFFLIIVLLIGVGVLVYKWFPYTQEEVSNTKSKRPKSDWSVKGSSYYSESNRSSPSNCMKPDVSEVDSLSLQNLSLHSNNVNVGTHYSSIFTPPTLRFPSNNHIYASSAAPAFSYYPKVGSPYSSPLSIGDLDARSHLTSVSQVSRRSKREKRHRRKSSMGLLRWIVYLLFGRLDTWKDLKAELVCMMNAVLVGVILVLICHLFYIMVPALWDMKY